MIYILQSYEVIVFYCYWQLALCSHKYNNLTFIISLLSIISIALWYNSYYSNKYTI